MNMVGFGWDLSWQQFEMVYHVSYRTALVFIYRFYLFFIKICINEKWCKINDSIELDQVRVL